ncbi:hypothetical protein [Azotobacter beijerinckii]|uniref:hypothetical protein n=1 Tax=Azotobacter beijerinckii TaxID=170623 RepID=UPI002955746E|nr:hypothetical protein [Azotobacter beijerinckii]MDV7211849.1 hypothetical protein [Azotobacter beijerinckii]
MAKASTRAKDLLGGHGHAAFGGILPSAITSRVTISPASASAACERLLVAGNGYHKRCFEQTA